MKPILILLGFNHVPHLLGSMPNSNNAHIDGPTNYDIGNQMQRAILPITGSKISKYVTHESSSLYMWQQNITQKVHII
jgi:hypothetical protein